MTRTPEKLGRGCFARVDPSIGDLNDMLEGERETNLQNREKRSKRSRLAIHPKLDMIKPSINNQKSHHRKGKTSAINPRYEGDTWYGTLRQKVYSAKIVL